MKPFVRRDNRDGLNSIRVTEDGDGRAFVVTSIDGAVLSPEEADQLANWLRRFCMSSQPSPIKGVKAEIKDG